MIRLKIRWLMLISLALVIGLACDLLAPKPTVPTEPGTLYTQAAATFMAQLTEHAVFSTATALAQPATPTPLPPTVTPSPTQILPTATPTPLPTATPLPPTPTPLPPTPTPLPCLAARFVRDVTVPDGTKFNPGTPFTKTWQLQNVGSCTWTKDYDLVFVKGNQMSGPDAVPLPSEVRPGEKVNISVNLVAPVSPGRYRGDWMLQDASGKRFGLGANANQPFWVSIRVVEVTEGIVFSFVEAYCSAKWETGAGTLPCPGKGTEPSGFVIRLDEPELENRKENEPALWTNPEMKNDGWITGTYPEIGYIKKGDRFLADIGCLADSENCDVIFRLNYRIGDGPVKTLGEWHEVYDGSITRVDVSLSDLEGKSVKFILTVLANGSYKDDAAFWLMPQIRRYPIPPTPTPTSIPTP